jgi:hypothetical protein
VQSILPNARRRLLEEMLTPGRLCVFASSRHGQSVSSSIKDCQSRSDMLMSLRYNRAWPESLEIEMIKSGPQWRREGVYLLAAGKTKWESWINIAADVLPSTFCLSARCDGLLGIPGQPANAESSVRKRLARRSSALERASEITITIATAWQIDVASGTVLRWLCICWECMDFDRLGR